MRSILWFGVILWWSQGIFSLQTNVTKHDLWAKEPIKIRLNCLYDYLRNEQQQSGLNELIIVSNKVNVLSSTENRLIQFLNENLNVKSVVWNYHQIHQLPIRFRLKLNIVWFAEQRHININIDNDILRNARKLIVIFQNRFHGARIELFARLNIVAHNQMRFIILHKCHEKQCECNIFGVIEYGCNSANSGTSLQLPHTKNVCTLNVSRRRNNSYKNGQSNGIQTRMMTTIANKLNMKIAYSNESNAFSTNIDLIIDDNRIRSNESLNILSAYAYDSLTFCIKRAGIRPKWQNVFALCQSIDPLIVGFICYYCVVITLYFQIPFQNNWNYDSYCMMLKALQSILCQSPRIRIDRFRAANMVLMWGSFLLYSVVISFYVIFIHRAILLYQVHTLNELIAHDFQLAGDVHTLEQLKKFKMVIFFSIF